MTAHPINPTTPPIKIDAAYVQKLRESVTFDIGKLQQDQRKAALLDRARQLMRFVPQFTTREAVYNAVWRGFGAFGFILSPNAFEESAAVLNAALDEQICLPTPVLPVSEPVAPPEVKNEEGAGSIPASPVLSQHDASIASRPLTGDARITATSNLDLALSHARIGAPVFPCSASPHRRRPDSPDKKPLIKEGFKGATCDETIIREWWRRWPDALVGLPCGLSMVVVDCDRHGGPDGVAEFERLIKEHGGLPNGVVTVITQSGGVHRFFRQPSDGLSNSEGALSGKGINLRGNGGYVICPGSVWRDRAWREADGSPSLLDALVNDTLPEPPAWLVALVGGTPKPQEPLSERAKPKAASGALPCTARMTHDGDEYSYISAALDCIDSDSRDTWLKVGGALHHAGQPWARGLWNAWSMRSPKFDARDQEKTWRGFGRTRGRISTVGSIIAMARENGFSDMKYKGGTALIEPAALASVRASVAPLLAKFDASQGSLEIKQKPPPGGAAKSDAAHASSNEGWPEPKPIQAQLPAVKKLTPGMLPIAVRDYVFDVAERQQSPVDFVATAAMCGLGAMVGNAAHIKPKCHDDWKVVPNLWGVIIGRPSAMKSPAMKSALAPVYALQDEMGAAWEASQHDRNIEARLAKLTASEVNKKAERALKSDDREQAKRILEEHARNDAALTARPRLIVNDSSVEKLGELLNENPNGLLLIRDELHGWLAKMQMEECASDRAFYLEAHNGDGQFTYDRIGRGTIHIPKCTLSLIGGIQPSRIAPLVRGATSGTSDDGLIQRSQLAVYPDDSLEWRLVNRPPNGPAQYRYNEAFRALHTLASEIEPPGCFCFDGEAQEMLNRWLVWLNNEARSGKLSSAHESHLLKMQKTIPSLALIFHLVDGHRRRDVGAGAMAMALAWADYLRSHAARLYAAGAVAAADGALLIIKRRAQLSEPFTARDVHRKGWAGLADREAVEDAIAVLLDTGHVRGVTKPSDPAGGRPSTAYIWNPLTKASC